MPSTTKSERSYYPYNLERNESKMMCLWIFIPIKLAPAHVQEIILWFDIISNIGGILSGMTYLAFNHGHNSLKWLGSIMTLMSLIIQPQASFLMCFWRKWLKNGKLNCIIKCYCWIRTSFFTFLTAGAVWGLCYHYHLWNESQKDYNDHDNKELPNTFYVVADVSRSIGSYSESITREIFYTINSFVGTFVTAYLGALGFFMKFACEKMQKDKTLVQVSVVNEEIELIEPNFVEVVNAELDNGDMPIQISQANKEVVDDDFAEEDIEGMPNIMPHYNAFQNQKAGNTVNIQKNSEDRGDFHKANTNFEDNEANNVVVQPLRKKDKNIRQDVKIEEIDLSDDENRRESVNSFNRGRSELFGPKTLGNKGNTWALPTGKNTETNQLKNDNDRPGTATKKSKSKKKKQEEENKQDSFDEEEI